jgi:hypothetical protein
MILHLSASQRNSTQKAKALKAADDSDSVLDESGVTSMYSEATTQDGDQVNIKLFSGCLLPADLVFDQSTN